MQVPRKLAPGQWEKAFEPWEKLTLVGEENRRAGGPAGRQVKHRLRLDWERGGGVGLAPRNDQCSSWGRGAKREERYGQNGKRKMRPTAEDIKSQRKLGLE